MGTETKINCYAENTAPAGMQCVPNIERRPTSTFYKNTFVNNGKCSSITTFVTSPVTNNLSVPSPLSSQISVAATTVPFVPIEIDDNAVIQGAKEILTIIRPSWDLNFVQFKKFTDGITNKLVGCFYNPPSDHNITTILNGIHNTKINENDLLHSQTSNATINVANTNDDNNDSGNLSDDDADIDTETVMLNGKISTTTDQTPPTKNVILVRVYGSKTDLLIDRKAETRNIILLHSYKFAPSLYATFKNGLVYDFVPGVTLNPESVLQPEIWPLVAQRMAEMHRLVKPNWNQDANAKTMPVPMLWKKTQSFFDLVPVKFTDANKHKRLEGTFLPITRMRQEFAELYRRLETLGSPVVFAHNDLLLGNVIYTESSKTVTFIDYEYADFNYLAFDIGNHFAEFAGVDTVDYTRYPAREFQLNWLRVYLQTYLQRSHITDAEVETLYVQVNQFALAAHFFWTIWSLIQAEHSTIQFDYVEYAFIRYNEYLAKKEAFLALDANLPKCKI